ncbi:MAG TPA: virulence-associated E family protein [Lachnospiraceae bacterium]|jgi:putative DNA primase/helicase|nr:virulence-associated E family protein [Lachnospiraceae bacterium]
MSDTNRTVDQSNPLTGEYNFKPVDPEKIQIAVGNRRNSSRYRNIEMTWKELKERNRQPIKTTETIEQYLKKTKAERDEIKDHGGYVGGWLKNGVRKVDTVSFRTLLALDADNIPPGTDFIGIIKNVLKDYQWFLYSTHSHTGEHQRYRIIILSTRQMTSEEYPAVLRMIAKQIGMDYFDDSTYQVNRMMFWASCASNAEFVFEESEADSVPLDPDTYLRMYSDWRDTSQWPTSSRQNEIVTKSLKHQEDSLTKAGIVGAFCRAYYPIQRVLDEILNGLYKPSTVPGRYDYIPGESSAGVVIYDDKYVYSHHATDPANGRLLNAYDLVRVHKFPDESDKKSFNKMAEFAVSLDDVRIQIDADKQAELSKDFEALPDRPDAAGDSGNFGDGSNNGDEENGTAPLPDNAWKKHLKYQSRSTVLENSVWNEMLILQNDPAYKNFAFNEMAGRIMVTGPLPWVRPVDNPFWRDADTAQLKADLDVRYVTFSSRNHDVAFTKVADDRKFHPIRDYLDSLPAWDKVCRVDKLLVQAFDAPDTPYVHAVTRKTLVAAIARTYHPGTKFDSVIVLDGEQGIGKSTLFKDLAGDQYYSETLSLTDMNDKSGAEKLQGFWIVEIGELAGMKKADIEKVKAFLSTSDDKYRPSYGKTVESHPRQCIIIGTVNGERGYLRDITGNRRFWVVKLSQTDPHKRWTVDKATRDQIWAEAKEYYEVGEKLYLEDEYLGEAVEAQKNAMEEDDRSGLVEKYLDTPVPKNWYELDLFARKQWLSGERNPLIPIGSTAASDFGSEIDAQRNGVQGNTMTAGVAGTAADTPADNTFIRDHISNVEIWCECFGRSAADMKPADSYNIASIMTKIDGWERTTNISKLPIYGRQRLYQRVAASGE